MPRCRNAFHSQNWAFTPGRTRLRSRSESPRVHRRRDHGRRQTQVANLCFGVPLFVGLAGRVIFVYDQNAHNVTFGRVRYVLETGTARW